MIQTCTYVYSSNYPPHKNAVTDVNNTVNLVVKVKARQRMA